MYCPAYTIHLPYIAPYIRENDSIYIRDQRSENKAKLASIKDPVYNGCLCMKIVLKICIAILPQVSTEYGWQFISFVIWKWNIEGVSKYCTIMLELVRYKIHQTREGVKYAEDQMIKIP